MFRSQIIKVTDYRMAPKPNQFVRIEMAGGKHLDIPTAGAEMTALADAVSAVRKSDNLNKAVQDVLSEDYLFDKGEIAVLTGVKPNTFQLLAVDENLPKTGMTGFPREINHDLKVFWL